MTYEGRPSVTIIGGGASGVLLAAHLLRDPETEIRVTLLERRGQFGQGVAYSASHREHKINVPARGALVIDAIGNGQLFGSRSGASNGLNGGVSAGRFTLPNRPLALRSRDGRFSSMATVRAASPLAGHRGTGLQGTTRSL